MNSVDTQPFAYVSSDAVDHSTVTPGGSIDVIHEERIEGWCVDPLAPHDPAVLELRLYNTHLAEFVTDVARPDIARCYGVETRCGFSFDLADIPADKAAAVLARYEKDLARRPKEPADLHVMVRGRPFELPRWEGLVSHCDNRHMLLCLQGSQASESVGWFDAEWYGAENPDVGVLRLDPYQHYRERGFKEGRPPNATIKAALGRVGIRPNNPLAGPQARIVALLAGSGLFDTAWYSRQYGVGEDRAVAHYVSTGAFLGHDPSPFFSSVDYLKAHLEAAKGGFNPLAHLIVEGFSEGGRDLDPLSDLRLTAKDWLKGL